MPVPALVLFDIDATLVWRAGPHHRLALMSAIRDVSGLEATLDGVPTHGKLDRDLIRLMMQRAGAAESRISDDMPHIVRRAQEHYGPLCPDLRQCVCPGVRHALRCLRRARIPLGVVTGNLTAIGWRKLEQAGLHRFFRFGAFAEEADTRAGLVRQALLRARKTGWLTCGTTVTLIGDHANDVIAAKLNGIRSIAVATGALARTQLVSHRPDVVLRDLRSLRIDMLL
jgi:phosphoglycolate phosphatase-like HAD superfamily hydrolase